MIQININYVNSTPHIGLNHYESKREREKDSYYHDYNQSNTWDTNSYTNSNMNPQTLNFTPIRPFGGLVN